MLYPIYKHRKAIMNKNKICDISVKDIRFNTILPIPKLLDLTRHQGNDTGHVTFNYSQHNFSPNDPTSSPSGTSYNCYDDVVSTPPTNTVFPIFGTSYYVQKACSDKKYDETISTYGMPFFKFKRGLPVNIELTNATGFSYNLHWHGLNTFGDIDGAFGGVSFGTGTKYADNLSIKQPPVTNNASLLWVHAHPMFFSSDDMSMGIFGVVDIIDDISEQVDNHFEYGDNYLILAYYDTELNENGTLNKQNNHTDAWRANYGIINGVSTIGWWSNTAPFVNPMYHHTTKNIVKIAIGNFTTSFRYTYVGVCDKNNEIKKFYYVQTDGGYRNPIKTDMIALAPANRGAILIDLLDFCSNRAYLFFYNFDLTEVFDMKLNDAGDIICTIQDPSYPNPTPNPTPIPDPNNMPNTMSNTMPNTMPNTMSNNNGDPSPLSWPSISPQIPQVNNVLCPGGSQPKPKIFTKKIFLKISMKHRSKNNKYMDRSCVIEDIRKLVFGENYDTASVQSMLNIPNFEASRPTNYINLLNKNYYYNIPKIHDVPTRLFALFPDYTTNYYDAINYGNPVYEVNPYGVTEYLNGANRIIVDMWNDHELNLMCAYAQYDLNKNNYKPSVLPTCLFRILSSRDLDAENFLNFNMLANDTLYIDIFDANVNPYYIDSTGTTQYTSNPLASVCIVFPAIDKPLNISEWTTLVNKLYSQTHIQGLDICLSSILEYDWTFFPYKVNYMSLPSNSNDLNAVPNYPLIPIYLKTVMIKNINKTSKFNIRMSAKWELLNFFGKTIAGMSGPLGTSMMNTMPYSFTPTTVSCSNMNNCAYTNDSMVVDMHGNQDQALQNVFTVFADPINPYNNATQVGGSIMVNMSDLVTFSIPARVDPTSVSGDNNGIYKGFIDGYQNDALMNFSVKLNSSEKWVYHNMDTQDSHPFHLHLTSGFADLTNNNTSKAIIGDSHNGHNQYPYSIDTYGVPSQQHVSWYLKFMNYTSKKGFKQKNIGFMYHCHYMSHHDMMMMGQYYVFRHRKDYF